MPQDRPVKGSARLQATQWGEDMTQDISRKKTPTLTFLGVQELAWTLGLVAMIINATERGLDWIWVGLLVCWQASIVWGFLKFRQTRKAPPTI